VTTSETDTAACTRASNPWVILGIVVTATFMQLVDVSIVNVAVPSIQRDLDTTYSDVQFVLIGYTLAFASLLVTSSRLGDLLDRRRIFLGGMTVFAAASALCGAATSPAMLIWSRVLQGLGGALMFPQVLAIIQVVFPPKERGKAFGVVGATIGIATITGPLLGGLLLAWDPAGLQWRSIFYVNLPIALAALAFGARYLPSSRNPHAVGLDLGGVVLSTAALVAIVYPLTVGREQGWPLWGFVVLGAGLVLLVAFLVYESRFGRRGGHPLVPTALFSDPAFRPGLGLGLIFFAGLAPFFFALSLYLQIGFGFTPLHAGLTTFPFALGSGFASAASDRLVRRFGRVVLVAGTGILVTAMLVLSWAVRFIGTDLQSWKLWPILVLGGVGLGLFVAPFLSVVLAGIRPANAGAASGVLSTAQQIGGTVGIAVIGIVLFGALGHNAGWAADQAGGPLAADLATAGLPGPARAGVVQGFRTCFVDRTSQADPTVTPPSCARLTSASASSSASAAAADGTGSRVGAAAQTAGSLALRENFSRSFSETLWYEAAVFLLSLLLALRLPRPATHLHGGREQAAAAPPAAT
jgi:EmrB/QacA subfamily drug resistance transporter